MPLDWFVTINFFLGFTRSQDRAKPLIHLNTLHVFIIEAHKFPLQVQRSVNKFQVTKITTNKRTN